MRRALLSLLLLAVVGCDGGGSKPFDDLPMVDRATHCPPRDPVECAEDVGGVYPFERRGTTTGADDGYSDSGCTPGGGVTIEDTAFRWTAPWSGRFRFTTEGSAIDTVLSLRQGSCAGRELACSDDVDDGVTHSEIIADLAECQTVTLVVDGANVDAVGAYVFSIGGFETACDNGIDDDEDGRADCDDDDCFTARCADPNDDWPDGWTEYEWGVLEETNRMRALGATCGADTFGPAEPLTMDPLLRLAARLHSTNMGENGFFDHTDPEGRGPGERVAEVGFRGSYVGENIARGQATPEEVVDAWMHSEGHCRNIMNPRYHFLGVGLAYSPADEPFWTQNFAGSDR
ncbi:MAG: CAP domain-containing protein [Myxococcales bacterium]|nr:CAP domain-containing protein [Myxococcales bacterium]